MKVLLVHPIRERERTLNVVPPIGLGYLATALRRHGHEPLILDCVKEGLDLAGIRDYVHKSSPQAVGFTTFSSDLASVKRSTKVIKELDPAIITLVGGPHPSGDPQGSLRYLDKVDYAFAGEAELGLPRLLDRLSAGNAAPDSDLSGIPGLVWRRGSQFVAFGLIGDLIAQRRRP